MFFGPDDRESLGVEDVEEGREGVNKEGEEGRIWGGRVRWWRACYGRGEGEVSVASGDAHAETEEAGAGGGVDI